jgi:hypothetical protein
MVSSVTKMQQKNPSPERQKVSKTALLAGSGFTKPLGAKGVCKRTGWAT